MRHPALLLAALGLILAGCAGSLFKTKVAPPTLYMLSAVAAAPSMSGAELEANLAVLRPLVRAGLDTDRIAALYPDRRLDYFADARWSGPLDEVMQDLAVQLLRARAGLRNVSGDTSAFASAYWLEIDVVDFQAEYAGGPGSGPPTAHVHLLAAIGRSGERRIIARFDADARQPAAADRLGAIVAAYETAANQALQQIAAGCAATLAAETSRMRAEATPPR